MAGADNEWGVLDSLLGMDVEDAPSQGVGPLAFAGRCSTEDNQDPRTSRAWQLSNAERFVEPLGGHVVAEYFDVGQSRSVPWERREQASRLLAELKNPNRGWSGVVLGEGTRCFFGNQFSLTAPKFLNYKVALWVPELGGAYDPDNASHKMLMSVLGGMSESERQHVQHRVRAAMEAQVRDQGRHQGGRAPYGYKTVEAGPHPNPRKAQEGYRLRVLALDPATAPVVERIYKLYLSGYGDRAIAAILNREGIPCPSAARPQQNQHRLADGWQGSAVRVILENPKYTGYAFYGRWHRQEVLLDPDDVAAGHVVRFVRSQAKRIVRSRTPAHPAIISVEMFTQVQLRRRSRSAGGMRAMAQLGHEKIRPRKREYALRGRIRHAACQRLMEAAPRRDVVYYRCNARYLTPGSPALADHPSTVYVPQSPLVSGINQWLADLFAPERRDATIAALIDARDREPGAQNHLAAIQQRITEAETRLRRLASAIEAGADPTAFVDQINQATAQRDAARRQAAHVPAVTVLTNDQIARLVGEIGGLVTELDHGDPARLRNLYEALGVEMTYHHNERVVDVTTDPLAAVVASGRVRGGT